MGYQPSGLIAKEMKKRFAFFPTRLYNGAWIFWESVYTRVIYTEPGAYNGFEPPITERQHFTPEEASIMKLRGENDLDTRRR